MRKTTFFKIMLLAVILLVGSMGVKAQTTINFDTEANWVQSGSTSFGSYAPHGYSESGVTIQGTNVLRNATTAQDGFAGAKGTYSMRVGNTAVSQVLITIASGGLANFSLGVRRWDGSPIPDYTVKYSTNGGGLWTSLTNINGTLLTTSDFFTYNSGAINNTSSNIQIEIKNSGTTERIMIDDFTWTGFTSSCTTSSLAFASSPVEKLVTDVNFTITPTTNSTGAITYSSSVQTVATVNPNTGEVDILGAGSTEITASQVADATYCAKTAKYTINVAAAAPTITVTEVTIPAFSAVVGETDTETINISGANLTTNIVLTIDGANADLFSVNSPLPSTGGVATIIYTPITPGTHTATLRLNSTGAAEETRTLTGTSTIPVVSGAVIISEVYGGGGNTGATLKNDFIELYNNSAETVQIGGWSVQYYSATGTGPSTSVFEIPEGKYIPSGAHFLILAAAGAGGTVDLYGADATSSLTLGGTAGKVILYNTNAAQTISDLASITGNPYFVDYVPYGTTAVPVWGTAMSSNTSNTTSATRNTVAPATIVGQRISAAVNYMYTGNINNDFSVLEPTPTSTGLSTGLSLANQNVGVYTVNGNVVFNATAKQTIEIFNSVGQRLVRKTAMEGLNSIPLNQKGVILVKVGNQVSKVIL